MRWKLALLAALQCCVVASCGAQEQRIARSPAVAGLFYPAEHTQLQRTVDGYFVACGSVTATRGIRAVVVPHAGYTFSGPVAARAFSALDPDGEWDNIFLIGPSHRIGFDGAAVYTAGNFLTPLGAVEVNSAIGAALVKSGAPFSDRADAQSAEHSIEVEIPFLQRRLHRPFRIVPIVIGTSSIATTRALAAALKPYFTPRNLFVVSTDFSHYPAYADAVRLDRETAAAVCSNNTGTFADLLERHEAGNTPALATSACGWSALMTLLSMTEGDRSLRFDTLMYRNSGDAEQGDRSRVVGYWAIAVRDAGQQGAIMAPLPPEDRRVLLALARSALVEYLGSGTVLRVDSSRFPDGTKRQCGAFVTLRARGALRGCIGSFAADGPLCMLVPRLAISSATQDPRFEPVRASELPSVDIEISVLSPMRRITSADEIVQGRHGVYMSRNGRTGTFLPQVWQETGWTKDEFLGHLARDKVGLDWNAWKDAELAVYEATVFSERETPAPVSRP